MSRTTIKQEIRATLEDLTKENFQKFCYHLRDRREEPRLKRTDVEDKTIWEITDLLVSAFTEPKALPVTVEILRQINCNEEAEALCSKTKVCVDKGDPTFPKTSAGELETKPSREALDVQRPLKAAGRGGPLVKEPEEVKAEAKARVLSEGGDLCNERLVLSRFTIQFGKYKGRTFKWLLENDVGYTAFLVDSHQEQREHAKCPETAQMANKDSLTQYATAYPEVKKELLCKKSLRSGREGRALVGFGLHKSETLRDLYESKDPQKISYVDYLRNKKSTCTAGSKMEVAVRYILQRDGTASFAPQQPGSPRPEGAPEAGQPSPRGPLGRRHEEEARGHDPPLCPVSDENLLPLWKSVACPPAAFTDSGQT